MLSLASRCRRFAAPLFSLGLLVLAAGCASVSIKDEERSNANVVLQPEHIYVANFETNTGEWKVDREGDELVQFKEGTAQALTELTVQRLTKNVAPAEQWHPGMHMKPHSWLITGRFTRVNQGSRILRAAIGFGFGGTKVETQVTVSQVQVHHNKEFLSFATTGGSNASPGAIASTTPISAAASLVVSAMPGLTDDLKRTARMTVASVSEYMAEHGWIAPDKAQKPKRIGTL